VRLIRAFGGPTIGREGDAHDFNNDSYDDLAIGVPGEDVTFNGKLVKDSGVVHVLLGSPSGLHPAPKGILRGVDIGDGASAQFGAAITMDELLDPGSGSKWGLDGLADLVVGAPGAAKMHLYGGHRFATGKGETIRRTLNGAPGSRSGAALATGNFLGSSNRLQLAIGAPSVNDSAGEVWIEMSRASYRRRQGDGIVSGGSKPETGSARRSRRSTSIGTSWRSCWSACRARTSWARPMPEVVPTAARRASGPRTSPGSPIPSSRAMASAVPFADVGRGE
jgi:hypothetical protein